MFVEQPDVGQSWTKDGYPDQRLATLTSMCKMNEWKRVDGGREKDKNAFEQCSCLRFYILKYRLEDGNEARSLPLLVVEYPACSQSWLTRP